MSAYIQTVYLFIITQKIYADLVLIIDAIYWGQIDILVVICRRSSLASSPSSWTPWPERWRLSARLSKFLSTSSSTRIPNDVSSHFFIYSLIQLVFFLRHAAQRPHLFPSSISALIHLILISSFLHTSILPISKKKPLINFAQWYNIINNHSLCKLSLYQRRHNCRFSA